MSGERDSLMQEQMDLAYACLKDTVRSVFQASEDARIAGRISRLRSAIERRYAFVISCGYASAVALLLSGLVLSVVGGAI